MLGQSNPLSGPTILEGRKPPPLMRTALRRHRARDQDRRERGRGRRHAVSGRVGPAGHHPRAQSRKARNRLILGRAYGETAPVRVFSETFYADADLKPGSLLPLPDDREDRGLYVVEGSISVAGQAFESGRMMVFRPGDRISVAAGPAGARLIILGGATLGGPRYIWWNFVASSQDRIEAAKDEWRKADWGRGLFDLPPDDRDEFTPLPPSRQ